MEAYNSKTMLVITDIDFSANAGDISLVLRRAEAFYNARGIVSVIVVLRKQFQPLEKHSLSGEAVKFFFGESIETLLRRYSPKMVLFTGPGTYRYISTVKQYNTNNGCDIQCFLDAHGAIHEAVDYVRGVRKVRRMLSFIKAMERANRASRKANGIFHVTEELKDYYKTFLPASRRKGFKFIKINCGSEEVITKRDHERREVLRSRWGASPDALVIVFSGLQRPWHCFDEMLDWFSELDKNNPDVFFVFFTNADDALLKKIGGALPNKNYHVQLLKSDELIDHLSACDIGVIMRDDKWTNRVAFPNKFSEYISAGLCVALSDSLREPVRLLQQNDIPFIDITGGNQVQLASHPAIEEIRNDYSGYLSKCVAMCENELNYEKQVETAAEFVGY